MPQSAEVEQSLVLLDTYNRQIEAVGRQLQFLQAVLVETVQAREALEGLRKEPSREILVPLGANTYLFAQAAKDGKVITGIGAGLSVEKSWEDSEARLGERAQELQSEIQRLTEAATQLQMEASRVQAEIEDEMQDVESGGA